jgi:hypothetical protein
MTGNDGSRAYVDDGSFDNAETARFSNYRPGLGLQEANDQRVIAGTYDRYQEIGNAVANGRYGDALGHLIYNASDSARAAAIGRSSPPPQDRNMERIDMMIASPLGAIGSLAVRASGGSQRAQDIALFSGSFGEQAIGGALGWQRTVMPARFVLQTQGLVEGRARKIGNVEGSIAGQSVVNPDLATRLDAYKAWKVNNDVVGKPTLKEFQLFENPARVNTSGFKIYSGREWPPNYGALDVSSPFTLLPGTTIDRFGSDFGSFLSPTGTSYSARAVRPGTLSAPYSVFQVTSPLDVEAATVAPWFGEQGMGTQFKLLGETRVKDLLSSGQLTEVYRGPFNGYNH